METMFNYTIRCTIEQTKTALKLGAPLFRFYSMDLSDYVDMIRISDNETYSIPTAEEMIGWLETHGIKEVSVYGTNDDKWGYDVWVKYGEKPITERIPRYHSRPEVTLAAIDAALEYLITCKNEK